jgi:hypothetical protein
MLFIIKYFYLKKINQKHIKIIILFLKMLNDGDGSSPVEEDLSLAIKANFIKDLSENVTTLLF